ncbi:MAG: hypothetical protein DRP85_02510 [Candidatus Makaraimicrobium thalassicum]|nr:MAG: hypothetical protein DRP85_02510 [Candidatus Omnitrophota bacterium]
MKSLFFTICIVMPVLFLMPAAACSQQKVIYNCEEYIQSWKIPEWSVGQDDHISPALAIDENFTKEGNASLRLMVAFPGKSWSAGIVETEGFFDLTLHRALLCDLYLPKYAPAGIEARVIIVTGEEYLWLEMDHPVAVTPGRRTTVRANLRRGNHAWKSSEGIRRMTDEIKASVCKIAIRIESNIVEYTGPVYIDNIRLRK